MQSTALIYDHFFRLIYPDKRLKQSIKSLHLSWRVDGLVASFDLHLEHTHWFSCRLIKVAAYLSSLARVFAIQVNSPQRVLTYLFLDLELLFPSLRNIKTMGDRSHDEEIVYTRNKNFLDSFLEYHAEKSSVFVVSTNGIYQDALIRKSAQTKVKPASMIDKPLSHFIGLEGAACLVCIIQDAYESNRILYDQRYCVVRPDLEKRIYSADVIPIPDSASVLLLVNRVKPF